jgi:hypothetical protein
VPDCKANVELIVQLAAGGGARVILTTVFQPGPVPLERIPFWSADVNVAVREVNEHLKGLESKQVTVLDAAAILAAGGEETLAGYSRDLLHLNDAGYVALNRALMPLLVR